MKSRSITARLIFYYTVAATALMLLTMAILYVVLVRHTDEEDEVFLADKLQEIRTELLENPKALITEIAMLSTRPNPQTASYSIRLQDDSGKTIAETPVMRDLLQPRIFPRPPEAKDGVSQIIEYKSDDGRWFMLLAAWASTGQGGETRRLVQLSQDRSDDKEFRAEFLALLVALLVSGAVAAAFIGRAVARRGLRPLEQMTRVAHRIEATHLNERVATAGWPTELISLALAFDQMLERLEDSFGRLSQFSADLAHELRTPIFNLRGEAEVALARNRSPEEYRGVMESSIEELDRISGLIDSLLFLARAANPATRIKPVELDAREEVHAVVEFHEALAHEGGVQVEILGGAQVRADALLFRRAVSNLLANALSHTPPAGVISIDLGRQAAGATRIEIKDTGCGIAPEHLPRLFDRFYRVDQSRSAKGTGLGLALVKSIMTLHGGSMELQSKVGEGTRVTLLFPAPSDR